MDYKTLLVEHKNAVTKITLNRPESLNALSAELMGELEQAVAAAANDADCRCVLLTGMGRGFSSGADLQDATVSIDMDDPDFGAALRTTYNPIVQTLREMPKPYIAAVNGVAAGAGCNIALAADVIMAARSAKFIQAFIKIGLVPDAGGTWTIPRLIGRARAMRWMMTGEALDAETADAWGLVSMVVDDDQLAAEADALAERLANAPTQALVGIKQLVDAALQTDAVTQMEAEASKQSEVGRSQDTMEGINSFLEKRSPQFTGK